MRPFPFACLAAIFLCLGQTVSAKHFSFYVAELPDQWKSSYDHSLAVKVGTGGHGNLGTFMVSEHSAFW